MKKLVAFALFVFSFFIFPTLLAYAFKKMGLEPSYLLYIISYILTLGFVCFVAFFLAPRIEKRLKDK